MGGRGVAQQLHEPSSRIGAGAVVRDRVCGGVRVREGGDGEVDGVGVGGVIEVRVAVEGRGGGRVGVGARRPGGHRRAGRGAREDASGGRHGCEVVRVWGRLEEPAELEGDVGVGIRVSGGRRHGRPLEGEVDL